MADVETIPTPGSDDARSLQPACECHPGMNGVTHPLAGNPVEPHHGVGVKPFADSTDERGVWLSGWVVNPLCPVHNSAAWREQENLTQGEAS